MEITVNLGAGLEMFLVLLGVASIVWAASKHKRD